MLYESRNCACSPSLRYKNMRITRQINCTRPFLYTTSQRASAYSIHRQALKASNMSTSAPQIENTNINTAPGVELSSQQKTLVGCVLDLFQGKPSKEKLQLWHDDATFEDPITVAKGRKKYEPQWYGLQQAFSEIERLSYQVNSSGNPITMDMKTRYVVKGINKEQTIQSVINIFTTADGTKIEKVEDKWDGELPDSGIRDVSSVFQLLNPFWWINYWIGWIWWLWSFVWYTRAWLVSSIEFESAILTLISSQVFRKLNSVTVPHLVSVPKSAEEEAKKGN